MYIKYILLYILLSIIFISTGHRGGMPDTSLFFTSELYQGIVKGNLLKRPTTLVDRVVIEPWIMSDAGFPLRSYMCVPFINI